MMLKKLLFITLFAFSFLGTRAQVTLHFNPTDTTAAVGSIVNISVEASGTGAATVAAMQLEFEFDSTILDFQGPNMLDLHLNFSQGFGVGMDTVPSNRVAFQWVDISDHDFTGKLFDLSFKVLASGSSGLNFMNDTIVSNATGIPYTVTVNSATITGGGATGSDPLQLGASSVAVDMNTNGCIDISVVDDFTDITRLDFSLDWDAATATYTSLTNLNTTLGLTEASNFVTSQTGTGNLGFTFTDAVGKTLNIGDVLFSACFNATGTAGTSTAVSFGDSPTTTVVENTTGTLANTFTNGTYSINNNTSTGTFTFSLPDTVGAVGSQVCVPVTVQNFVDITSVGFAMEWDTDVLSFVSATQITDPVTSNPMGNFYSNLSTTGDGVLAYLFVDFSNPAVPRTLPEYSALVDVCFDVVGVAGDVSPLAFKDTLSGMSVGDANQNLIPYDSLSGSFTIPTVMLDTFHVFGDYSTCTQGVELGDTIAVDILVDNLVDMTSFQMDLLYDTSRLAFLDGLKEIHIGSELPPVYPSIANDKVVFLWLSPGTNPYTWMDSTAIFTLYFEAKVPSGNVGDNIDLVFANATGVNGSNGSVPYALHDISMEIVAPLATNSSMTDLSCGVTNDGTILISPSGGSGSYTYAWTGPGGPHTGNSLTGLSAGTYTVTVTSCNKMIEETFVLTESAAFSLMVANIKNETMPPGNNGEITVAPSVAGSYTYAWTGPGGPYTGAALTGLAEGEYVVVADNGQGCTATLTVGLNRLMATGTFINPTCNGANTGSITLDVSGGNGPYSYQWNAGPGGVAPTGLAAGTYTVTVSDQTTAQVELSFVLLDPSAISIQFDGTTSTASGMNTGGVNITVSGGTPNASAPLYGYLWSPGGATTEDLSNVGVGNYTVLVTDANGCTSTAGPYSVSSFGTPNPTVSVNDVDCNGENSGSITISSITSGTPNYVVTGTGNGIGGPQTTDGNSSIDYTSLEAGSYSFTITDANLEDTVFTVQITEPDPLVISNVVITPSTGTDGSIVYDLTGGTTNYNYDWNVNNFDGLQDIFGLPAATYTVTITDAKGCELVQSFTVDAIINTSTPVPTVVVEDANCSGGGDGKITISSVAGDNPDYTITGIGSPQTTNGTTPVVYSGLSAGAYQLTLTDNIGTDTTFAVSVGEPSAITFSSAVVVNEVTPPGNNGSINIDVTGGTPNYSFQWTPGGYNTEDITGIPAGTYQLIAVDVHGCTRTSPSIEVIQESSSFSCSTNVIHTDCPNSTNGSISLTTFGGNPALSYEWKKDGVSGIFSTDKNLNFIGAGEYHVTVTDEDNAKTTCDASVSQQSFLLGSVGSLSDYNGYNVSGQGLTNGVATATAMNGATPYQFEWSTGTNAATANNLEGGINTVTITDNIGCVVTVDVDLTEPDAMACVTTPTATPCPGSSEGSISVAASGGVNNISYSYEWAGPNNYTSNDQNLTGLEAGVYLVTITDANGNITNCNATVTTTSNMTLTIDVLSDYNGYNVSAPAAKDGMAKAVVNGGVAPYQYVWGNGDTNLQADTLGAGLVGLTVTDNLGCTVETNVVLSVPGVFSCSVVTENTVCPGSTDGTATVVLSGGVTPFASYFWTGPGDPHPGDSILVDLSQGTYNITVTDANGVQASCSGTVVQLSNLSSTVQIISAVTQSGAEDGVAEVLPTGGSTPYTFEWSNGEVTPKATSLPGGSNTVTVTDALDCESIISFVMSTDGVVTAVVDSTRATCFGVCDGTASVTVTSGQSPFTYLWSNNLTGKEVGDLCAGMITVTVTDADGKTTVVSTEITEPDSLHIEFTVMQPTAHNVDDGSAVATVTGGTVADDYKYIWHTGSPAITTATLEGQGVGEILLIVSDDNNCTAMESIRFDAPETDDCFDASKIITPSVLDGSNDLFEITCLNSTTRNDLTIFSRWGHNVYHHADYDGTWTGIDDHGNDLPEGAYFWVLKYTQNGKEQTKKGHVTIIR